MNKYSIEDTSLLVLLFLLTITLLSTQTFAQITDTKMNMTNILFDDFYPMVTVEYESDSLVVLRSDDNVILPLNGSLAPLWNAIDIVEKESDFTFKQFATTELTIDEKVASTMVFYAIMIK